MQLGCSKVGKGCSSLVLLLADTSGSEAMVVLVPPASRVYAQVALRLPS